ARRRDLDPNALAAVEIADDMPGDAERVAVVERIMVGDAGDPGVHLSTTELLGGDHLAGRGTDQGRPAEKDRPLPAHDDRLISNRRDKDAARRAGAPHQRALRHAGRRKLRLVVEDAPE